MSNEMNKKISDTFLASIGEAHLESIESIPENMDLDMSDLDSWFEDFNERNTKEQRKIRGKRSFKFLLRIVALFLISIGLVFTGLFAGVEAFRVEVLNFITTEESTHTLVQIENLSEIRDRGVVLPEYFPKGMSLFSYEQVNRIHKTTFKDENEHFIYLHQANLETQIQFDTEKAEVSKVLVNDLEVSYILKGNIYTFYWYDNFNNYSLVSNISYDDLIEIIKFMK